MSNDQDLIAQFLAKKGVTEVPTGAKTVDDRDWKFLVRSQPAKFTPSLRETNAEQRSEQFMEQVREAALMGGVAAANEVMGY